MPQIDQLPYIFGSQLFWLLLVFGIIFGVARGMLPKIQSVVDAREKSIADRLEQAQAARDVAEKAEAQWRTRNEAVRAEAARVAEEAKRKSAHESEARVKAAIAGIDRKTDLAMQRIREALAAAQEEMEEVAAEAAREMVDRLIGIKVDRKAAAEAVAAELRPLRRPRSVRTIKAQIPKRKPAKRKRA